MMIALLRGGVNWRKAAHIAGPSEKRIPIYVVTLAGKGSSVQNYNAPTLSR